MARRSPRVRDDSDLTILSSGYIIPSADLSVRDDSDLTILSSAVVQPCHAVELEMILI